MSKRFLPWASTLVFVALIGAACGEAPTAMPRTAIPATVAATPITSATAAEATLSPEAAQTEPADTAPTVGPLPEATPVPGRPDAPAGIADDFRSDPASVVAATGRPQLLEFFTTW